MESRCENYSRLMGRVSEESGPVALKHCIRESKYHCTGWGWFYSNQENLEGKKSALDVIGNGEIIVSPWDVQTKSSNVSTVEESRSLVLGDVMKTDCHLITARFPAQPLQTPAQVDLCLLTEGVGILTSTSAPLASRELAGIVAYPQGPPVYETPGDTAAELWEECLECPHFTYLQEHVFDKNQTVLTYALLCKIDRQVLLKTGTAT
ncbi:hypothetical protein CB1_000853002 [Camelus ferus]|nr:hypothetical protein CB1_000853002 [Camelus ferus]